MKSRLRSTVRMSNTGYHQNGKPNWWARLGRGESAQFLNIPHVRGDNMLDIEVDLPPGTEVFIGAGRGTVKTIRETSVTDTLPTKTDVNSDMPISFSTVRNSRCPNPRDCGDPTCSGDCGY